MAAQHEQDAERDEPDQRADRDDADRVDLQWFR